jgi:hypothetical protein
MTKQKDTPELASIVRQAIQQQRQVEFDESTPTSNGSYQSPLFVFTRFLKSYLPEGTAPALLWPRIKRIVEHENGWDTFAELGEDEAQTEFLHCWESVRHRMGSDLLAECVHRADREPLRIKGSRYAGNAGYRRFLSFCGWLAVRNYPQPIALPQRKVAEVLGLNRPVTVGDWIKWAVDDRYMEKVAEHRLCPGGRRLAAEFHFTLEQWACLVEALPPSQRRPLGLES